MTTKTNNKQKATVLALVLAVSLTGMYSCNNNAATEEKKPDTAAAMMSADTTKMVDTLKMKPMDTTKLPSDTGRETKVPKPPNN